jgi:hypothetical protein
LDAETWAALAHHEAAHAVVDVLGGLVVDRVAISPAGGKTDVLGLEDLEGRKPPRDEYRERAEPYLVGQLAGGFGERSYTGEESDSGDDDRQNAYWLASEICPEGESVRSYLDRVAAAASAAVEANWPAIQAVAQRLIVTNLLSRSELEAMISAVR